MDGRRICLVGVQNVNGVEELREPAGGTGAIKGSVPISERWATHKFCETYGLPSVVISVALPAKRMMGKYK